jgi:hypothetical protein
MTTAMDFSNLLTFVGNKTLEEVKKEADSHRVMVKECKNVDLQNLYLLALDRELDGEKELTAFQRQCNGMILEKETNKVVCACQSKIKDVTAEEIKQMISNKETKKRFEYCEDGTIIRLYNYNDNWYTATTRCIDAKYSFWTSEKTFDDMFWDVFDKKLLVDLNKNSTYVFILLHKENRIVVRHNANLLVFISEIQNETLVENYSNIFYNVYGIKRPKLVGYVDLERHSINEYFHPMKRGIVVKVFENNTWTTNKVDFENYHAIKSVRGNVPQIRMRFLELLDDPSSLDELQKYYNEHYVMFNLIKSSLMKLVRTVHKLYIESHVKHTVTVTEDNMYYRTLKQLHAQYKTTNKPIKYDDVQNKLFSLDKKVLKNFLGWV